MKSILLTGCNRGIGLGMVKYLANKSNSPKNIFATCRKPEEARNLQDIAKQHSNIKILRFDLKNFNSYENLVSQVSDAVKDEGLNVLFNNAGVTTKFTRINLVKLEQMMENLTVNTVAPLMLTKALLPLLKKASNTNSSTPVGISRAAIINVSSILGSIGENNQGGFYPYRSSKENYRTHREMDKETPSLNNTQISSPVVREMIVKVFKDLPKRPSSIIKKSALNAITRSLSFDLKDDKILAMSLHPGWIKTDMGGVNAPLEVEDAVKSIVTLMESLTEKHNGGFYQYDGKPLPW